MAKSQKIWGANALFSRAHYTLGMWHRYKGNFTFLLLISQISLNFHSLEGNLFTHKSMFHGVNFPANGPIMGKRIIGLDPTFEKMTVSNNMLEVMWLCSYNSKEAVITVASFTLLTSKYCNSSNSWISFLLSYRFSSSEFDGIDATEENAGMKGPGENGLILISLVN